MDYILNCLFVRYLILSTLISLEYPRCLYIVQNILKLGHVLGGDGIAIRVVNRAALHDLDVPVRRRYRFE